ncbi:Mg2+ and Co2+ transporter CorA [Pseudomonas syringae pv. actinidiae]|uniref:Mg2+ and Co2+ transporter CorA n=1 Tax=Pseudomonas syringae pv. actinidiae TaxID=103796 RepID=A0A2V0QP55_PSESF|nr:Mg2+ and Co2+ transporter CorA [Pseudomonas syringae pv. actinidiae]
MVLPSQLPCWYHTSYGFPLLIRFAAMEYRRSSGVLSKIVSNSTSSRKCNRVPKAHFHRR